MFVQNENQVSVATGAPATPEGTDSPNQPDPQAGSDAAEGTDGQPSGEQRREQTEGWAQRRLARVTADKYRERARADAAERELAQLRAAMGASQQPAGTQPGTPPQHPPADSRADAQNIEARARQLADEQMAAQAFNEAADRAAKAGLADIPGFDQSVKTLQAMGALFGERGEPTDLARTIMESEVAHRIIDALAKDPDQADRILDMSPRQQARAIGLIEARLLANPTGDAPAQGTAAPTNGNATASDTGSRLPPPIRPQGTRGVAAPDALNQTPGEDATRAWIQNRNRQLASQRR